MQRGFRVQRGTRKLDVKALRHWMVDNNHNLTSLARTAAVSASRMSSVLRSGISGELVRMKLEKIAGIDLDAGPVSEN